MRIEPMAHPDIAPVAEIHGSALRGDFLPSLGPAFLRALYAGMLDGQRAFGVVAREHDQVLGFVIGTADSGSLFGTVLAHRFIRFSWLVGLAVIRRPALLWKVAQTFLYPGKEGAGLPAAELLVIAVRDGLRGQGVGKQLVAAFDTQCCAAGVNEYKVTVLTENERANMFYRSLGFQERGLFNLYGKDWRVYVKPSRANHDGH